MSQWSQDKKTSVIHWLNENAILQDLSAAQGRVPVRIEGTAVGAGDKPPVVYIKEETEEEFYRQCPGDGGIPTAPDLQMIQEMLDMVRDVNTKSDEEECPDKPIVISKPNPQPATFTPSERDTSTPINQPSNEKKKKPKRQRNFAIELLLQSIADKDKDLETEQKAMSNKVTVLHKPEDYLTTNHSKDVQTEVTGSDKCHRSKIDMTVPTAIEKVNGWIETQTSSPFPKKTTKFFLDSSSIMFKKKSDVKEKAKNCEKIITSPSSTRNEYKPSEMVDEYYQKFVEQNRFKEAFRESIWTKLERDMKEIDEKRRLEAATSSQSQSQSFEETQNTEAYRQRVASIERCLDVVALSQHRHDFTATCVVCEALTHTSTPKQTHTQNIVEENDYALSKCPFVVDHDNTIIVLEENIPQSFIDAKKLTEPIAEVGEIDLKENISQCADGGTKDGEITIVGAENETNLSTDNIERSIDLEKGSKVFDSTINVAQLIDLGDSEDFQENANLISL